MLLFMCTMVKRVFITWLVIQVSTKQDVRLEGKVQKNKLSMNAFKNKCQTIENFLKWSIYTCLKNKRQMKQDLYL